MQPRVILSLLLALSLLLSGNAFGQKAKKPLLCGTSPAMDRQQQFLHQRSNERRVRLLGAGTRMLGEGGRLRDLARSASSVEGDILVMSGDGGVILGANQFPGELIGRSIQFQPADAAATSYRVQLTDEPYRLDAIAGAAINLRQPASGGPIDDDDSRDFDLPFPFPMYGESHTRLFVNSNGHITFGDADFLPENGNYTGFLAGPPKIAGATLDLDPPSSANDSGIYVFLSPTEVIVSFVRIVAFGSTSNFVDFQIRFTPDGAASIIHRRGPFGEFVVGITPGGNRDFGELVRFTSPPADAVAGSIAEIFSGSAQLGLDVFRGSQVFFETQPDDYDYLVFYNDADIEPGGGAVAFEITVRNATEGIGDDVVDRGGRFGSTGRLQAVLNMGPLSQYPADPNGRVDALSTSDNTPLTVLAHEAGHRFLAFPRLPEGSTNTSRLLGRQLAHWSFRFNAHGSFMEGSDLSAPPTGDPANTYLTGPTNQRYSELDRYLMGLIPPEQVGIEHSLFFIDGLGATARAPQAGVTISGTRRDFSIDDIIAANGKRVPDHTIAQRRFRFAFVLVTNDITKAQPAVEKLDVFRREFVNYFNERSGGLAVADTSLKPGLRISAFPATGILQGAQGTLLVSRASVGAALPLAFEADNGVVILPPSAAIPEGAASQEITFTATQPGVARIRASASAGEFLPAEATIAVATVDQLSLQLVSSARVQASPDSEALTPILVKVIDSRGLPYQGVPVRFEPATGGSALPSLAITNSAGEASFRWTVGSASPNLAKVFVESARATTELTVTALEDLLPDLRAATNAANFTAGISPGSLGTLFGVSLSAGTTRSAAFTPLPTELAGVNVTVNGASAPLIFVSDQQINFFVPSSVSGEHADIQVSSPDGKSNSFTSPLVVYQPGIFFDAETNLGAVLRANSGQKTNVLPALPDGFIEIFATGLGPVVSAGRGVFRTASPVVASLGGIEMEIPFSGLAPGFVGLYQVNARVPSGLAPGVYSLRLTIEGQQSNEVNVIVGETE